MNKKKTLLWLDDKREPNENEPRVPKGDWDIHWVKNAKELMSWIAHNGIPYAISFDHDLHEEHYTPQQYWHNYELSKAYQNGARLSYKNKTGGDVAKDLLAFFRFFGTPKHLMPKCFIHTDNPVGRDWIIEFVKDIDPDFKITDCSVKFDKQ